MQPVLMATPRSCRGFRRLYAEISLPPNLTHVGLYTLTTEARLQLALPNPMRNGEYIGGG